jgi:uncharacterized protein
VELTNEFRVGVPVEDAWAILTDVERIAPCMPGAQLQEVEGDQYRGIVKIKVGPITAQYKGTASFAEQDVDAHRVVLKAEGRDTRGQGNASATVTATLVPDGDGTKVTVVTDLTITGKVAQFGRGVLADVSGKLLGQFVDNLERDVLSGPTGGGGATPPAGTSEVAGASAGSATSTESAPAASPAATAPTAGEAGHGAVATEAPAVASSNGSTGASRRIDHPEPEPVDLFATAGTPVAKRVVPLVGGLLAVFLVWRFLARRRR